MPTFYDILGVRRDAEDVVIRGAYRALMLRYHPDTNKQTSAQARAQKINEAYATLSNAKRRAVYDAFLLQNSRTRRSALRTARPRTRLPASRASYTSPRKTRISPNGRRWRVASGIILGLIALIVIGKRDPTSVSASAVPGVTEAAATVSNDVTTETPVPTRLGAPESNAAQPSETSEQGLSHPDLSALASEEKISIGSVCATQKFTKGPGAYDRCLADQLSMLAGVSHYPDLSALDSEKKISIDSACATQKFIQGPAAYDRCLRAQLSKLPRTLSRG
jgi:hypothetical protein